jgi:site-specific DNA-methyltransferase (adenine-specific)
VVNLEDAGAEVREKIIYMFGSGFPKSKNMGLENPEFDGYGSATKPAHEPIVLARKPLDGTLANNALKHGCGGLNIDECRIGTGTGNPPEKYIPNDKNKVYGSGMGGGEWDRSKGRFPANVIHDGSEQVVSLFPDSNSNVKRDQCLGKRKGGFVSTGSEKGDSRPNSPGYDDRGSASRFFYTAKPSPAERSMQGRVNNTHITLKPLSLMRYLVTLVKQPQRNLVLDPFAGSGTTGLACLELGIPCVLIEREKEYFEIACQRLKALHDDLSRLQANG